MGILKVGKAGGAHMYMCVLQQRLTFQSSVRSAERNTKNATTPHVRYNLDRVIQATNRAPIGQKPVHRRIPGHGSTKRPALNQPK
jgi:hypothetical protein